MFYACPFPLLTTIYTCAGKAFFKLFPQKEAAKRKDNDKLIETVNFKLGNEM